MSQTNSRMPGIRDRNAMYGPGPQPYEGTSNSNGFGGRGQNGGAGYYYSRDHSAGPSSASGTPKSSYYKNNNNMSIDSGRSRSRVEDETPSYWVEHLATFAVGKQYGLEQPADGIRKLKQMEKSSAIWAQPMILRLKHHTVLVEDENGEVVEQFAMQLVQDPTAHLSTDPRDVYNNILLFIVREDRRHNSATPTEMHIFQCNRVSANEVVDDFRQYLGGHYARVQPGRRDKGFVPSADNIPQMAGGSNGYPNNSAPVVMEEPRFAPDSYTRTEKTELRNSRGEPVAANGFHPPEPRPWPEGNGIVAQSRAVLPTQGFRDDGSASSDASEYFERDVNTLNRCFDDIERFVARIQSAALAQRELEAHTTRRRRGGARQTDPGILAHRAQLPAELEFVDVLQKFKLSFNLLAKLKNHIHEPNAPELLHFLFTPLTVILDACQWGVGRNIAPSVISPLLTRDAVELMKNCLTSKESDVWMALGEPWRIAPEDWPGALPAPYRPVFADGYMPYGPPGGPAPFPPPAESARPTPRRGRSVDNLDRSDRSDRTLPLEMDRMTLEQERLSFEKEKLAERERRVFEQQKLVQDEKKRLEDERRRFYDEQERQSTRSHPVGPSSMPFRQNDTSAQSSPAQPNHREIHVSRDPLGGEEDSPRQRAFVDDLRHRQTKVAKVTYDRRGQNAKELTVFKGEYLEVLSDSRNWWECRNVHNRIGYVPHTILTVTQRGIPASAGLYVETDPGTSPRSAAAKYEPASSIEVSNVAIQTNLEPPKPVAPVRAPVVLAPPPAPGPAPDLGTIRIPRPTSPVRRERLQENGGPKLEAKTRKRDDLYDELRETVSKPFKPRAYNGPEIIIDESSDAILISQWLQSKGFSPRTMEVLRDLTGAPLFALGKPQLQQFIGREEGNLLYSKLLVQKSLSGYNTKTGAQLQAILNARRPKSDQKIQNGSTNGVLPSTNNNNSSALTQLFVDQSNRSSQM